LSPVDSIASTFTSTVYVLSLYLNELDPNPFDHLKTSNMQFSIAILALFAAVAIASPINLAVRQSDTAPVMTNAEKQVVPFVSTEVVTKE